VGKLNYLFEVLVESGKLFGMVMVEVEVLWWKWKIILE
jgi:hypothetical protein